LKKTPIKYSATQSRRQCFGQTLLTWIIERTSQQQRTGVIIDTIAVGAIRHRMNRMLEKPGVVAHGEKMTDLHLWRSVAAD
jgi:hypothetical protein